jgi:glycosyltransferase involved in cell wall biosynthesis
MLGIALLLEKNQIYRNLRFVLLMRYSVIMAAGPFSARKPALDKATAEKYSLAFEVICAADPDGVVKFVTDSDGLAKEFMQFSRGRVVSVLPIPHTLFLPTAAPTPAVPAKDPQRLRIIYLGDAREEKGFAMLPAVVRACHQARQPVEFVFQAFISSPYHQQMAAVIEELDRLNLPQVRLIRTTLDPISYQALLHSADLVLIPHDAVTYHSRTSGTFVEAICADKPVVAPGNSWMSDQLKGGRAGAIFISGNAADFARAVQGAVNDIAIHRQAAAELGRNFREYHNPQNFLQQLRLT